MKNLKRLMGFAVIMAFLFTSCSKDEESGLMNDSEKASLSFATVLNDMAANHSALKQALEDIPECSEAAPAYVEVVLSGAADVGSMEDPIVVDVNPTPQNYDGDPGAEYFTEESADLELVPGTYMLDYFAVYDASDNLIWVAPHTGGELAEFVDAALPVEINLGAGVKKYVDVDVLCYDNRMVNMYGYLFFDLETHTAVDFCFFANYCDENGRHFTANYSVNLWAGTDDTGEVIYSGEMPATGVNEDGDFYAEPLCLAIPGPGAGVADDEAYLYYEVTLEDWGDNYGAVDPMTISGTLSYNDIMANFTGDDEVEYEHLRFGCGDDGGNGGPTDSDQDGVIDNEDNCPNVANPEQTNSDGDSYGDACDNCPDVDNEDQADFDGDGMGDACDPDDDNDGVIDENDQCPNTPAGAEVDENGCEVSVGGCLPDPNAGCITASFSDSISDELPIDWMYEGTAIGTLGFTIDENGDLIIGASFFVQEGYGMDDIEVSVNGSEPVCFDTDLATTVYEVTIAGDFSYDQLEVDIRANLCDITP